MIALKFVIVAIISYLLGSLNFGVILSKKIKNEDVRNIGSGNAGTTNMMRTYGKPLGFLTILGDILKVVVAIIIAFHINPLNNVEISHLFCNDYNIILLKLFSGLFAVIGHIFPCFFQFKGGKGVATSGGMVFVIDWRIAVILLLIFGIIVFATKYVSLGSIIMALLFPVFMGVFHKNLIIVLISLIFTFIVVVAHRGNIKKLLNHTENKIGSNKSKSTDD